MGMCSTIELHTVSRNLTFPKFYDLPKAPGFFICVTPAEREYEAGFHKDNDSCSAFSLYFPWLHLLHCQPHTCTTRPILSICLFLSPKQTDRTCCSQHTSISELVNNSQRMCLCPAEVIMGLGESFSNLTGSLNLQPRRVIAQGESARTLCASVPRDPSIWHCVEQPVCQEIPAAHTVWNSQDAKRSQHLAPCETASVP